MGVGGEGRGWGVGGNGRVWLWGVGWEIDRRATCRTTTHETIASIRATKPCRYTVRTCRGEEGGCGWSPVHPGDHTWRARRYASETNPSGGRRQHGSKGASEGMFVDTSDGIGRRGWVVARGRRGTGAGEQARGSRRGADAGQAQGSRRGTGAGGQVCRGCRRLSGDANSYGWCNTEVV